MQKFVYPIKIKTPFINPFKSENDWKFWTKRFWKCFFTNCDPIQWEEPIHSMLKYYQSILIEKDGIKYLPKGTKLYHGSTIYPFLGNSPSTNQITFFGLDVIIALWYILEEIYIKNDNCIHTNKSVQMNGYLYEFVIIQDLPITHIIDKLVINPKDKNISCKKNPNDVCLHPQIAFHGISYQNYYRNVVPLFDLCNEITFRFNKYTNHLQLKNVFLVDPLILHKNANKKGFDPTKSIVSQKKYKEQISCQQYKKNII